MLAADGTDVIEEVVTVAARPRAAAAPLNGALLLAVAALALAALFLGKFKRA